MPKKQLQNTPKASEYFAQVNEHLKNDFILYGEPGPEGIRLLVPKRYTSLKLKREVDDLASAEVAEPIHLTKTVIATGKTHNTHDKEVSTELAIVNANGEYDALVWTTTADNIQKALRAGIFESSNIENPLAKIIAQLGDYQRLVFSRSVEDNFIVAHNQEKLDLVEITQNCIEALLPLHCCINNFSCGAGPQENLRALIEKLEKLQTQFQKIKTRGKDRLHREPYETLNEGIAHLCDQLDDYKTRLIKLLNDDSKELTQAEIKDILRAYGSPLRHPDLSLQHFLQTQLNSIMNTAVEANYAVSLLFQDTSNLQKYITKAQITSEKFSSTNVDYNNPFTPEHAFDFSSKANADGLVTINFRNYNFEPHTRMDLAKQVALIYRVDSNRPLFTKKDNKPGLLGIRWNVNPLAPFNWLANGIKNVVSTIADTFYIAGKTAYDSLQSLRGKEITPARFPGSSKLLRKIDLSEEKYAKLTVTQGIFDKDAPVTEIPYHSLIQSAYATAKNIFSRYIADSFISISNFVVEEFRQFKTAKRIYYDVTLGTKPVEEAAISLLLNKRLSEMSANQMGNAVMQASLLDSYNELTETNQFASQTVVDSYHQFADARQFFSYEEIEKKLAERKKTMPAAAVIPYSLTPDKPGDLVSWAISDFTRGLTEVFSHEIYRGHPIAGLAFTVAASTAAPMLAPALAHNAFFAAINQKISVPLAKTLLGKTEGLMPAFSISLLQGQISYLGLDIFNGNHSLLKNGLQKVMENPVIAGVLGIAAISFGYAVAYEMHIPFLSQAIVEETSQASFPYFQLGIAGAKIAAILVEGTLNLDGSHHQSGEDLVTQALDQMHDKIEEAIRNAYMQTQNIKNNNALTDADKEIIKVRVAQYCEQVKNALQQPQLAAQISQLSQTVAGLIGAKTPANFMGVAPVAEDEKSQNQLLHFLQRRMKRQQIALLDPMVLSERDKFILLHYVTQAYPDDPEYVAAIRNRFATQENKKSGPLGQTLNIILSYPGLLVRALVATTRSLGYVLASLWSLATGDSTEGAQMLNTANIVLQPARELARKIKNDLGLLVKATASVLRVSWGLIGGVLLVPVTLVLSPLSLVTRGLKNVASFFDLEKVRAFFKRSDSPRKIFAGVNKAFFAPGIISQMIDTAIGGMRSDANGRNITLATRDTDIIEFDRRFLNSTTRPDISNKKISRLIAPEVPLQKRILSLLKDELSKYSSLKSFVDADSYEQIIGKLYAELSKTKSTLKFYGSSKANELFRKELKIALFSVNEKINHFTGVSFAERQTYQEQIMDLLYARKGDPINEFKDTYAKFIEFELSDPEHEALEESYNRLAATQYALKTLETSYDIKQPYSQRSQSVVNFLREHDCLSLQVAREIVHVKKIIADNHSELKSTHKLEAAENMLQALGIIHKSARTASHKLAIYAPIREALIQLHGPRKAVAPKKPVKSAATNVPLKQVEQKSDLPETMLPYLSLLGATAPTRKKPILIDRVEKAGNNPDYFRKKTK